MTKKRYSYRVDGIKSFGSLSITAKDFDLNDLKSTRENYSARQCLTPILVQSDGGHTDVKILKPGYLDYTFNFYACPIESFFIQINEYSIKRIDSLNYRHQVKFLIFSKDFKRDKEFVYQSNERNKYNIQNITSLLNLVNKYIDFGNSIDFLDLNALLERRLLFLREAKYESEIETLFCNIMTSLVELGQVYENSCSRAGKDNEFWYEFESEYLPKDPYLSNLLINTLSDKQDSQKVKFTYGYNKAWSSSHGKFESEKTLSNLDIFTMTNKLIKAYDSQEHSKMSFNLESEKK